jgi:hypothetical protein
MITEYEVYIPILGRFKCKPQYIPKYLNLQSLRELYRMYRELGPYKFKQMLAEWKYPEQFIEAVIKRIDKRPWFHDRRFLRKRKSGK